MNKKKIFFFQQRNWGIKIGHHIAKRFNDNGCEIGAVTFKKEYYNFYTSQQDFKYKWLKSHEDLVENPKKYLGDDNFELSFICEELEIESIWIFVQSLRGHVKSYSDKYGYGYKQNVSDEEIIFYIKAIYKLLLSIKKEFDPDIIFMPNFVSLTQIMAYYFAKKHKIKIASITNTFATDRFVFANDIYESTGKFFDIINFYKKNHGKIAYELESIKILEDTRNNFKDNKIKNIYKNIYSNDFFIFLKDLIKYFIRLEFIKFKKTHLFKVQTQDYAKKSLKLIFRDYFSNLINKYKCEKLDYYKLDDIKNFVFMALQNQPEDNIDVASANYNNQIETARRIAMNLPKDLTLLVKEHPAMHGERSYKYMQKILKTPNVKLIHHSYNSIEILKRCSYLISTTGTIFYEAAVLKKKSIVLGNLGFCEILPNVKKMINFDEIPKLIREFESEDKSFLENYDRRMLEIISASLEAGFNNNYSKLWSTSYNNEKDLDKIYQKFNDELNNN